MSNVFVIVEHKEGQVKRATLEILGHLKSQGIEPTLVALGAPGSMDSLGDSLGKNGAGKVVLLENEQLKDYTTEGYANALHQYLSANGATAVLTGASIQGKDLLPRLAAKFKVGMASDCVDFKTSGDSFTVRRPVYAGKCSKQVAFTKSPAMFSVRPNVLTMGEATETSPSVEKVSAEVGNIRAKVIEVKASESKALDLTEADIIVSGGRSLKSEENFKIIKDCAAAIGAAAGASRAAVDAGYAGHDMQVGQTGKTVSPKLYIACGISGAIQHLAGMRTSKVIVAINKDPEAPIFSKSDYGIVGDLFDCVPLLTEEFKKLKSES